MEISKENVFKKNYTSVLESTNRKKKSTTSILKFIKNNKFISFTFIIFIIASCFNFVLMYNFFKILETLR